MIIIDGHNLLWAIKKINEDTEAISDVQLCWVLSRYFRLIRETGQVVFDGTGPRDKSGFDNINNLEVFFSGQSSADTMIEDKIKASTASKRLTIVSSDRRLRRAAQVKKATAVKSEVFWGYVLKQLTRRKAVKEPPGKRMGLTESETEQWLKFFGLEQ